MPIESATNISELDPRYPLGNDPTNEGDDHLQTIKQVLKLQFPGAGGDGFATPILATEQEINWLVALTGNVQDQLDAMDGRIDNLEGALSAPAGTAMVFYNTDLTIPTGWTIDAAVNDSMMRVVSTGAGSSVDGLDSPILMDKVPLHTHTAATGSDGAHQHTVRFMTDSSTIQYPGMIGDGSRWDPGNTAVDEGGHNHAITIENNIGGSDWTPNYSNVVIAVKDA